MTRRYWTLIATLCSLVVIAEISCELREASPLKKGVEPVMPEPAPGTSGTTPIASHTPLLGDSTDYFPNPSGAWWDFGTFRIEIRDTTAVAADGRTVQFQLWQYRGNTYYIRKEATEVRFFYPLADTGHIELRLPPRVGETWYYWRAVAESTISVPAGRFERAIKVEWIGHTGAVIPGGRYRWYAPGVGIIIDKIPGLFEQTLKAYGVHPQ